MSRRPLVPVVVAVAAASGVVACVLDWSTPGAGARVAADASADGAPDARGEGEAGGGADAASDDASPDAARDCAALRASLDAARGAAQACTSGPGSCAVVVTDECTCKRYANAAGPATTAWERAVADYLGAGCVPTCPTCPFVPPQGLCVASSGGLACSP